MSTEPSSGDAADLRNALVGGWRLERWEIDYPASGRTSTPFGADAEGLIVYAPDGWMSVVMRRRERLAAPRRDSVLGEHEKAECFSSYVHYAGRWRIDGGEVVHEVEHALHPDLVGTEQRRRVEVNDDILVLAGEERLDALGSVRVHRVRWLRAR
jgi:hypothetical protein